MLPELTAGRGGIPDLEVQAELVRSLRRTMHGRLDATTVLETHISYILLTGQYTYKIKKAVNLGFLDFSTLERRRFYCERELRLNRRFAPDLYLEVVPITGTPDRPILGGAGAPIDYAVKMREFPQDALLSRLADAGKLTPAHVDALAGQVAAFHDAADVAPADGVCAAEVLARLAEDNFTETEVLDIPDLDRLRRWSAQESAARMALMRQRQSGGFVRECHGDLHLGNIALVDDAITIFDGIEFNDDLRWIDVLNDVAFTTMDLEDRGRRDLSSRFLNAYLERTGDYSGLGVLKFFQVYRAMVRAKVIGLRLRLADRKSAALREECRSYVRLARRSAERRAPGIVIMHGLSGSGKTTCSQTLLETTGAIRLRTDVERKRLHAVPVGASSHSPIAAGLYDSATTLGTYRHIRNLAGGLAGEGYPVIADGAFLARWQRDMFRRLATDLGVPFVIVSMVASAAELRQRVAERHGRGTDASEADSSVLEHQLATQEPLSTQEKAFEIDVGQGPSRRFASAGESALRTFRLHGGKVRVPARLISAKSR